MFTTRNGPINFFSFEIHFRCPELWCILVDGHLLTKQGRAGTSVQVYCSNPGKAYANCMHHNRHKTGNIFYKAGALN